MTSIGIEAFNGCTGLTSIFIGKNVGSIAIYALSYCPALENIVIDKGNCIFDSREDCNAVIETATNTLIFGCKNTKIPYGVTRISEHALLYCTGLKEITIPKTITNIDYDAFYGCTGLTNITIPNSVTTIESSAFYNCTALKCLRIEDSGTTLSLGCNELGNIFL